MRGLKHACFIRAGRLATVNDALVGRKLGEITARDRTAVAALFRVYLPWPLGDGVEVHEFAENGGKEMQITAR